MSSKFEGLQKQFEQSGEMTPEQAGKAVGDFLKGFSEATKDLPEQTVPAAR